ncbi:MAG: GDP-mannose 4,6-dehydratase [Acidiferrobacterales bacterium]|nr:GDP-mannose 4,6-dehydratase [Acidiferrobacterales bacterium]
MSKTALITGITGQDAGYMAKYLLSLGYRVFGSYRRTSSINFWRLQELEIMNADNFELVDLDLTDPGNAMSTIATLKPDEVYNLAAQSFVEVSFKQPVTTTDINGLGTLHLLEAIRLGHPEAKFYQASTSELYGLVQETPQNEATPFYPRSPYAVAKLYAHWITVNYRESYDLFASCGILFNHESPMRGKNFVTRKITDGVARVKAGLLSHIELGNIDAKRDWGFTEDYVKGMHRILQAKSPDNYVLATGRTETVRSFVNLAFAAADIEIEWQGSGTEEIAINTANGQTVVCINTEFYRPAEVELLLGDASKAKQDLGWEATTSLEDMAQMMVEADIRRVASGASF